MSFDFLCALSPWISKKSGREFHWEFNNGSHCELENFENAARQISEIKKNTVTLVAGHHIWKVFTFPRLFLIESMESIRNSIWNPWNECWLRPQPISYSMNIMDSRWIPLDFIWNASISTLDSMEQSIWSPWNKFNSMIILLESRRNHLIWLPKIVAS